MNGEDEKKNGKPKKPNDVATKMKGFFVKNWRMLTAIGVSVVSTAAVSVGLALALNKDNGPDVPPPTPPTHTDGLGLFYYDAGMEEYQISLADDGKAIYTVGGETKIGTYTVNGATITVKFDGAADEMIATLDGNILSVTYGENQFRFFKKVYYKVSYDEMGGTEVADTTVVNGKTFENPDDPTRAGYEFLGWYVDSEYSAPYMFGTQLVTGDITLYAQWALVDPSVAAYTVDFDMGYDAPAPAFMETKAGKLYNAPKVEREGYKFCGWWMSMDEDGNRLTRKWTEDTVFTANTTLFAVWENNDLGSKLSNPEVQIFGDRVQWNGVEGASRYSVKVTDPTGYVMFDNEVTAIEQAFDFADMLAGDYKVEVTAIASSGAANNSDTVVRYYKNKAVGRVSQFSVIDGMLIFNRVPDAEYYEITVDCGDDAHQHTNYNNGESIYYNFANCVMQPGGIKFWVTAKADGYASVTSEVFVYNRTLDKVEGVAVDEDTQMVSWYPVKDATNYIISIACGTNGHTHTMVDVGAKTSYSLKECAAAADGKVTINVYAQTKGYNSPAATKFEYEKTKLATPGNIAVSNSDKKYMLTWDEVAGADEYVIMIGDRTFNAVENSFDITTAIDWVEDMNYQVSVKAKSATTESVWSDPVDIRYYTMDRTSIKYKAGVVSWEPVLGATGYEVYVNVQTTMKKITNGDTFAEVELTQAGTNTIYVRYIDEANNKYGTFIPVEVKDAQEIVFDYRNADGENPATVEYQYKVTGDKITLPTPKRAGYDFAGWYNTAKGPEANGKEYKGGYFTENQDMVLYAYWVPAKFKANYVKGEGQMDDSTTFGEVYYTQHYKLDVPKTEGDTVFLGWFLGTTTTSEQLTDDRGYSIKPWNAKADATVYALYINKVLEFTPLEDGTYSVTKGINATKVTSITIPETYNSKPVTVVDGFAFKGCSKLVSVTIPNTVTLVEYSAFQDCKRLEEVNVVDAGAAIPTYWSVDGVLIHWEELTGQTQLAYYPQAKQGVYEIPEGVTEIPMNLFEKTQVTEITIPTSMSVIQTKAFYNCSTLRKITFAPGGTNDLVIEDGAFQNCANLTSITLPARLTELQINEETHTMTMFSGCDALTHINVELGNQTYASNNGIITNKTGSELIFCPTARKGSYTIPSGIETIAPYAFFECKNLTEVIIPGWVKTVGAYAFAGCDRIARIEFSSGAVAGMKTDVGEGAFSDMSNLKMVTFADGSVVNSFGERAFANAIALRELTIPTTMTYIGDYAFEKAASLHTISFANGDEGNLEFGDYVFSECKNLTEVNLPKSVTKLNLGVFDGCINISNVFVDDANEHYQDIDGVVYSKDGTELLFFPKGRNTADGKYVILDTVETISEGAFKGMHHITTIEIPNSVTMIGKNAFANSGSLTTLTFQDGNDTAKLVIAESAFAGCGAITSVELPVRTQKVGDKAFYNVSMTSISFPTGLEEIGNYAFAQTAITEVQIPAGVAVMGESVFAECLSLKKVTFETGYAGTSIPVGMFYGSAVEDVTIPGSITSIGFGAFADCNKLTTVIFEEGTADLILGVAATSESGAEFNSKGVFASCTELANILLPDRVTLIGDYTFSGCKKLPGSIKKTVEKDGEKVDVTYQLISETSRLTRIGKNAFESCQSLGSIYIPGTVQNTAYVDENTTQEYAIGEKAFYSATLSNMTFGEGTGDLSFGYQAFAYLNKATYDFPARLAPIYVIEEQPDGTRIASWKDALNRNTFDGNSSIENINVTEGGKHYASHEGALYKVEEVNGKYVKSILYFVPQTYKGQNTNYTLNIPYTVREVASSAAYASKRIKSIVFEETPTGETPVDLVIKDRAFYQCGTYSSSYCLKALTLPERLTTLDTYAFYGCTYLESITLPSTLTTMTDGGYQFSGCTRVKTITFAENSTLKAIPSNAFNKCGSNTNTSYQLKAITIPASVESIGASAFDGCKYLAKVDFEENSNLTSIGRRAFHQAVLTSLTLPDKMTTLSGDSFGTLEKLTYLQLPASFTSISTVEGGQNRFLFQGLTALQTVQVGKDGKGTYYSSRDGVLYNSTFTELVYYPIKKAISHTETVDGVETTTDGKFVVPAGVQSIGAYAFNPGKNNSNNAHKGLTRLVISKDVMSIAYKAFASCTNLTEVIFEEGRLAPLTLGDYAFQSCSGLKGTLNETTNEYTFTIPSTIIFSGSHAFASCSGLTNVVFAPGNESTSLNNTFNGCTRLKSISNIPMVSSMNSTFNGCTSLAQVTFEEDKYALIETMQGTFKGCTSLKSIELPNVGSLLNMTVVTSSWKPVGSTYTGTFEGCTSLESVTFKGDCLSIAASAFKDCVKLKSITMPSSVVSIGDGAFYGCTSLAEVNFSGGIDAIPTYTFAKCTSLKSVNIPDFVSTIANNAFDGCTKLADVTFGAGVTTIGEYAFNGTTALASVTWNDGLETIGNYAFYGARGMTEISLPSSVMSIGDYAFANCSNVASVTLQDGISSIGTMAFANCSKLTAFTIPVSLETLGIGAFSGCSQLVDVDVAGGNINYTFDKGILYNAMKTAIIFVFPSVTGDIEIPGSVLAIGEGAFQNTTITSIVLPDTITEIPANAFKGCRELASVKMPVALEKIGAHAFDGCVSLTSITIPKTVYSTFDTQVTVSDRGNLVTILEDTDGIGAYAFANCTSLENVIFEKGGTQRLSIGDYAFMNCISLKGVQDENTKEYVFTIPYRVRAEVVTSSEQENPQQNYKFEQSIGIYAFAGCTSLTNVVFEETGAGTFNAPVMLQIGAFYECASLKSVKFSSHLGNYRTTVLMKGSEMPVWRVGVQAYAFSGCRTLTEVVLNGSFKNGISFDKKAFDNSGFTMPKDFVVEPETEMCEDPRGGVYGNSSYQDSYFYQFGAECYVPGSK